MWFFLKMSLLILTLGVFDFSFSKEIEKVEVEVITVENDRQMILETAVGEVSRNFVKDFLGEEKFDKEKDQIENNIIKNKNRYILFTKIGQSVLQDDDTYLTSVNIGLSRSNLKALLVEHHLFYSSEGSSCVLPIVVFKTDLKTENTFIWWRDRIDIETSYLHQNLAVSFYSLLNQELIKNGFYNIDPIFSNSLDWIPEPFKPRGTRAKDFTGLSSFLVCDIVLSGTVLLSYNKRRSIYSNEIAIKVFNIKTKQDLFNFNKTIKFSSIRDQLDLETKFRDKLKGVFKSILFQLSSYKDKGSLDLTRMMLSLQGPLNYHQKEIFKKYLVREVPSIKNLKKIFISSNKVIYEAEVSSTIIKVVKDIRSIRRRKRIPFQFQLVGYNKKQLNIYAKEK